jgi:tetratricopeptide (TPR) repeat protein
LPLHAQGEFALLQAQLEPALELPGQPVKRGTMAHQHIVYMMLADSAANSHNEAAVRRYAAPLEELATKDDHRPYQAVAHRAWGVAHRLAGEHADAEARLNQALELFEVLQINWQAGRTLVEFAELEMARSDQPAACGYLERALTTFEGLRAMPDVERTKLALEACTNPLSH